MLEAHEDAKKKNGGSGPPKKKKRESFNVSSFQDSTASNTQKFMYAAESRGGICRRQKFYDKSDDATCKKNDQSQIVMCHVDFKGPTWLKLNIPKIQPVKSCHVSSMMQKILIILLLKLRE